MGWDFIGTYYNDCQEINLTANKKNINIHKNQRLFYTDEYIIIFLQGLFFILRLYKIYTVEIVKNTTSDELLTNNGVSLTS